MTSYKVTRTIDVDNEIALEREHIAVWFRKFEDGDVIALWDDGDHGQWISSYQHIGQHSEASRDLITDLAVATPGEYGPLKHELETRGYNVTFAE